MRTPAWLERHPRLHRLMTRTDAPWPAVRDVGGLVLVGLTLYLVLISATGQFFHGPPVVVVESGSMMHCAGGAPQQGFGGCPPERYGRVGTIDPGDLIFVRDVDARGEVATFAGGGRARYGEAGDTIIYRANGNPAGTPVIHRAMFWLEVHGDGTYSIPELGVERTRDLSVAALGLDREAYRLGGSCLEVAATHGLTAGSSGFVTKGDNNPCFDQSRQGFAYHPVRPAWVVGKARGEVPWVGLVKLGVFDVLQGTRNYPNAPGDVKVLMVVSLTLLIGGPLAAEAVMKRRHARREAEEEAAATAPRKEEPPGPSGPPPP